MYHVTCDIIHISFLPVTEEHNNTEHNQYLLCDINASNVVKLREREGHRVAPADCRDLERQKNLKTSIINFSL